VVRANCSTSRSPSCNWRTPLRSPNSRTQLSSGSPLGSNSCSWADCLSWSSGKSIMPV